MLVGTPLYVHQVVSTIRASDNDVDAAAEYLGVPARLVRTAVEYYAEFRDDVDADAESARRFEDEERARWERRQRALA